MYLVHAETPCRGFLSIFPKGDKMATNNNNRGELKFNNRVVKVDLKLDHQLFDFLDDRFESMAIHNMVRNDEAHLLLIEVGSYEGYNLEENDPIAGEDKELLETFEAILEQAEKQGFDEIELERN